MDTYNVRIALHGASAAIYDMMTEAMVRMGASTSGRTTAGVSRPLRPGEYIFQSNADAHGLMRDLQTVIRAIWIDSAIRVTGQTETCSTGVEPIPQPPTENISGTQKFASLR